MKPIDFPCRNMTLGPPQGQTEEACMKLPVFFNGEMYVSKWELSDEDIKKLIETKTIYLGISSPAHPPVWLDTEPMFEENIRFSIGDGIFCKVKVPGTKDMAEISGTIEELSGTYFVKTEKDMIPLAFCREFTIIPADINA